MVEFLTSLSNYIQNLADYPLSSTVFNQYKTSICVSNITEYLNQRRNASYLFLGEGAGYLGCAKSGIAFTSGNILTHHRLYSSSRNAFSYEPIMEYKERSSTIVHNFLDLIPSSFPSIIMWNIFPFHPHEENKLQTNRKPTKKELEIGLTYLKSIFEIFPIKIVCAIGNSAYNTIKDNLPNLKINAIRHPSYGGATIFQNEMKKIFNIPTRLQKTLDF